MLHYPVIVSQDCIYPFVTLLFRSSDFVVEIGSAGGTAEFFVASPLEFGPAFYTFSHSCNSFGVGKIIQMRSKSDSCVDIIF